MASQLEMLGAARVNSIFNALQDIRTLPQQLIWSQRVPDVPATDEEIVGRFQGKIYAADLIADDAKAVVYMPGKFQFETVKIPNLKLGIALNQAMINQLRRIDPLIPDSSDLGIFSQWQVRLAKAVDLGVKQRKEALIVAMMLDGSGTNYNRLGIQLVNPSWGMPSTLKVTTGVTWDTAGSANPVNDVWGVELVARTLYGYKFNRITMSTAAFRYMIATTEFQNKARLYLAPNVSFTNLTQANITQQQQLAANILGMAVELYDARYWIQNSDGSEISLPFMPIQQVILSDSANDGNTGVYDFANTPTTEGVVASVMDGGASAVIGNVPTGPGPISYVTGNPDLNPPNLIQWGVQRGFPRKHILQATAALTVGTFADQIPVGVPFPL